MKLSIERFLRIGPDLEPAILETDTALKGVAVWSGVNNRTGAKTSPTKCLGINTFHRDLEELTEVK